MYCTAIFLDFILRVNQSMGVHFSLQQEKWDKGREEPGQGSSTLYTGGEAILSAEQHPTGNVLQPQPTAGQVSQNELQAEAQQRGG